MTLYRIDGSNTFRINNYPNTADVYINGADSIDWNDERVIIYHGNRVYGYKYPTAQTISKIQYLLKITGHEKK